MTKKDTPTIAFFGTPEFSVHVLEQLKNAQLEPDVIITAPDRPAGRGLEMREPPVKVWALQNEIPVLQPESLKPEDGEIDLLQNSEWDLFIVAAYGKILKKEILDLPYKGVLNVHPSLLPKYRGASPIEAQILADENEVGVSIMLLDEKMDHGPVLAQARITPEDMPTWPLKASELEELLATEGGKLLADAIPLWIKDGLEAEEQHHKEATYTKKIKKEDGLIELGKNDRENYLKFLAYDEWPGIYFMQEGKRIKITEATFENGKFTPTRVIPEGKKETTYSDFS